MRAASIRARRPRLALARAPGWGSGIAPATGIVIDAVEVGPVKQMFGAGLFLDFIQKGEHLAVSRFRLGVAGSAHGVRDQVVDPCGEQASAEPFACSQNSFQLLLAAALFLMFAIASAM